MKIENLARANELSDEISKLNGFIKYLNATYNGGWVVSNKNISLGYMANNMFNCIKLGDIVFNDIKEPLKDLLFSELVKLEKEFEEL